MTRRLGVVALAALMLLLGAPVLACGPWPLVAWFWLTDTPNEPLDRYLSGHLGILDPRLDRAYKYVAYRTLAGLTLDDASQAAIAAYWQSPRESASSWRWGSEQWENARRKVPGLGYGPMIFEWRDNTRVVGGYVRGNYYVNCYTDAFITAAKTLDERMSTFGAASQEVREWVAAQDQVFSNCQHGEAIPEALPEDRPASARADRAYQIAAAHLYAQHLEETERRFREIAQDPQSPWRVLSAYLVARAIVRQGTLAEPLNRERLAAAGSYLRELLANDALAEVHPAARRLLDYVEVELDPPAKQRALAAGLLQASLDPAAGKTLSDYLWLLYRYRDAGDDLADWVTARRAAEHWANQGTLPWLAAAIMSAPPLDPTGRERPWLRNAARPGDGAAQDALIAAAAQVPPESPAYLTVAYHRARLLMARGRAEEARTQLDDLLRDGNALSLGDRNRILSLRAVLATELGEFLRLAQQVPVVVDYDEGGARPYGSRGQTKLSGQVLFSDYAARVLDRYFTPRLMLDVLGSGALVPSLQRRVALTAWTRAVLTEDDAAGDVLSYAAASAPELRGDLERYRAASGPGRQFAVAVMLLRFPGLQLSFGDPVGRVAPIERLDAFRDNWWCTVGARAADGPVVPSFLTAEQQAAAAAMNVKLSQLDSGPLYLGRIVLAWAEGHPHDPLVPEALHRVVKATRFGCIRDEGATSKAAFQLLHRRYPSSEWTARTPFWFR